MKKTNIIIAVIIGLVVIGAASNLANKDDEAVKTSVETINEPNEPVQTNASSTVSNDDPVQTASPVTKAPATEAPVTEAPDGRMKGEGAIDDAYIKIVSARKTIDYEDSPAIVVTYEYTNNGKDAKSFMFSVKDTVFQSGIECSTTYAAYDDDTFSSDNQSKDIKPGATLTVDCLYKLNDETSNVDVEIAKILEFFDPPTLVVKTFTLQ
ncbi:MAG: DUF5067 domain-containing protein [Eubacteriales bacterium]